MALRGAAVRLMRSIASGILYFAVILDGGKGENIGLPPSSPNGAAMTPPGKPHPKSHRAETTVNGFLKQAPKMAQHFLTHDGGVNDKKSENGGSMHDEATSIRITRPLNDSVFFVGDVVVAFATSGFTPSVKTPIEVLVPQNGNEPALLESGTVFTLGMDTPFTQLVTVSAVVQGRRVSSSVVFSTVLDQATILFMRAPLPVDAVWGIPSDPASRLHEPLPADAEWGISSDPASRLREPGRDPATSVMEAGSSRFDRSTRERGETGEQHHQSGRGKGGVKEEPLPSPLSLVYVGSLSLDGQKHIWLQQMEGLSRRRFAPTFLTFQDAGGDASGGDDGEAASTTWKREAADSFERRVRRAGVSMIKVASPRLVASDFKGLVQGGGAAMTNDSAVAAAVAATPLKEAVFELLLDSVDRAGGEPGLMSPAWAREVFTRIAGGVRKASPDVLVVASGRTLGDVVLTRAARWAMGGRGRIVVDFPNMEPVQGISADVLATPSHFVARHPDIKSLAEAAGARVVVIPPGVHATPSPQLEDVHHQAVAGERPNERSICHPGCKGDEALDNSDHCDPACLVVGFVGRLAPEKGPGLFLAVAEGIAELIPSVHFVIVGDGPLRPDLEAMASRLGLDRRVHFVGWAEGESLQRHLAGMSLLFNPSLVPETFCVSNIEAMAAGTPVAAFGVGGMLEYLSPGANSFVLDDADPRAAAAAIASVLRDRPLLERLAAAGKRDVFTSFRADTALERWADLYETLGRGE